MADTGTFIFNKGIKKYVLNLEIENQIDKIKLC